MEVACALWLVDQSCFYCMAGVKLSVLDPPGALHLVSRYPEAHHIVPLLIDLGADKEQRDEVWMASLMA